MRTAIRRMGNSNGLILPKPVLAQLGLHPGDTLDLSLEEGRLVLVPSAGGPREGWAEAARQIAAAGDDALVWPDFANAEDAELQW